VAAGAQAHETFLLDASDHWYDLSVTLATESRFLRRFAGKVETGKTGRTDPGIGAMSLTA
jgi:phospholipase C